MIIRHETQNKPQKNKKPWFMITNLWEPPLNTDNS
jgi:hypothetical protein